MKQVMLDFKTGKLALEEVPSPSLQPGGVLVRNLHSLISLGTESTSVDFASKSLLGKARARPDLAKKVIAKARNEGAVTAYRQAMSRLERPEPLGYSCAGEVIAVGSGVADLKVGDKVACAGVGYASHAEVIFVPRNLCVKVAADVDTRHAAFTTVGAIAMQGLRIADLRLGESAVVIGLGLLGQITVQLLKASGCRVVGIDLDPAKIALAQQSGADAAFLRSAPKLDEKVQMALGGSADAVLITAATNANDPIELAGELCRDKGKVVAVGAVRMDVPRNAYYAKELSVHLSRSYGPGRYDREYEEGGRDYPIQYVRWTENRNMQAFADLLAANRLQLEPIVTHEFPVERAMESYGVLKGASSKPPLGVLISYPQDSKPQPRLHVGAPARASTSGKVRLGFIGAGGHARSTILPAAKQVSAIELHGLATATGLSGKDIAKRYGFGYCTTNSDELIADPDVDAVAVMTRNSLHASQAIQALAAGKHVFVEKPIAVNEEELGRLTEAYEASDGHVFAGFNRRYSPYTKLIQSHFAGRTGPMVATFRVNAESIPRDSWIYDASEGGGRLITEVCHFVDLLQAVVNSPPTQVNATAVPGTDPRLQENLALTVQHADGSISTVIYTNQGPQTLGKESAEFFADGKAAQLKDWRDLKLIGPSGSKHHRNRLSQEKGHREELQAFADLCSKSKDVGRATFDAAVATTRVTFAAARSIAEGRAIQLEQ